MQIRKEVKIAAIAIAAVVVIGAGIFAFKYINGDKNVSEEEISSLKETAEEVLPDKAVHDDVFKDESVYIITSNEGKAEKIIVDDWIDNTKKKDVIKDKSELKGIEVVKGETSYDADGNSLSWETSGSDIYYEGTTSKQLPVTMDIKYYLDGKSISADRLSGKSGKLKICISYKNHELVSKEVSGSTKELYVPFTVISGLALDSEKVDNVKVSNGKVLNTGDQCAVIGFAMPGLNEDMEILSAGVDIDFPDEVEITADVEDFSLETVITVVTSDIAEGTSVTDSGSFEELESKLDELTDGIDELVDGSSELYDGMKTLLEKTDEFKDGMAELNTGINKLDKGIGSLNKGAVKLRKGSTELSVGAEEISAGLKELDSKSSLLNDGMDQAFKGLLDTVKQQLDSNEDFTSLGIEVPDLNASNYEEELEKIIAMLEEDGGQTYENAKEAAEEEVRAIVEGKEAQEQIREGVEELCESKAYAAVKKEVNAKIYGNTDDGSYEDSEGNISESRYQKIRNTAIDYLDKYSNGQLLTLEECENYQAMTDEQYEALEGIDYQGYIKASVARNVNGLKVGETADEDTIDSVTQVLMKISLNLELGIQEEGSSLKESEAVEKIIEREYNKYLTTDEYKEDFEEKLDIVTESYIEMYMDGLNDDIDEINVPQQIRDKLSDGAKQVHELLSQLQSFETLVEGVKEYTSGVSELYSGSIALVDGAKELQEGAEELKAGSKELKEGSEKLKEGSEKLYSGSKEMIEGEEELTSGSLELKKGIKELDEAFDGNLGAATESMQALIDIMSDYDNYSGKNDKMAGSVKFIYRSESVGENEEE